MVTRVVPSHTYIVWKFMSAEYMYTEVLICVGIDIDTDIDIDIDIRVYV